MTKVITYGTYDLLHEGHIRLLERAKALGDYLIVGVTADGFDLARGKINVQQSLMERIEAVRQTGLADQIIIEEYEGQKIDDIRKYDVDIFTVGSDWIGKFEYLNEYCKVVYLDRTKGISSSEIRSKKQELKLGIVGETNIVNKFKNECRFVNGINLVGVYASNKESIDKEMILLASENSSFNELLGKCDAVYIASHPTLHYKQVKAALEAGKHVLCESPVAMRVEDFRELQDIASSKGLVLMDGIKTAYSIAYRRMVLLVKGGIIGDIVSVNSTCTSLIDIDNANDQTWNSITSWGPTAMLPVLDILGNNYNSKLIVTRLSEFRRDFDEFTKIDFVYPKAVASVIVGSGVKSEGDMRISGTKGYIYIPSPWWKTDYFEVRFENASDNKRYFYQLDGEGIRYEIGAFARSIQSASINNIESETSIEIVKVIEDFSKRNDCVELSK